MFKRIKDLFSKNEEPEPPYEVSLEEIPDIISNYEQECVKKREQELKNSRTTISVLVEQMKEVVENLGGEESEAEFHPKVEQVTKHTLPQFKKKISTCLVNEFSGDDEEWYSQVAESIQCCFKAYRGPGRYLHHLYPEGIAEFRETLDCMGKELNKMTEVIKESRERLFQVNALRAAYDEHDLMVRSVSEHLENEDLIADSLVKLKAEFYECEADKKRVYSSSEFKEFEALNQNLIDRKSDYVKAEDEFRSLARNAVPAFRRALRLLDADNSSEAVELENLIELCEGDEIDCSVVQSSVNSVAPAIFRLTNSGNLTLKNSFEKSLFADTDSFVEHFRVGCESVVRADSEFSKAKEAVGAVSVGEKVSELEKKGVNLQKQIDEKADESVVMHEKQAEFMESAKDAGEKVVSLASELLDREVVISGLYQSDSNDQEN